MRLAGWQKDIIRAVYEPETETGGRVVTQALLTFARAVGEFGSTILVSGNLAGRTQTAPLYIFAKFNEGQIEAANAIAIVLALFSFLIFSVLFFARDWLDVD